MEEPFAEWLPSLFKTKSAVRLESSLLDGQTIADVSLRRDEKLDLLLVASFGGPTAVNGSARPGTIRAASDTISFEHRGGWAGTARGVVDRGFHFDPRPDGTVVTERTFSIASIDAYRSGASESTSTIEWVLNVKDFYNWNDWASFEETDSFTQVLGRNGKIRMRCEKGGRGGQSVLRLKVETSDIYIIRPRFKENRARGAASIVFPSSFSAEDRKKTRESLAFALGSPIVYLGFSRFDADWQETEMMSVDAMDYSGRAFDIHALSPYPITSKGTANDIDGDALETVVNNVVKHFDRLNCSIVFWQYWNAVISPPHSMPVQIGAIIEQMINKARRNDMIKPSILAEEDWKSLRKTISEWLDASSISADAAKQLAGKVAALNQASPLAQLRQVFATGGLELGELEEKAWAERNRSAHAGPSSDPIKTILNTRLLKIIFHRIFASLTGCSDQFVDYYNLDFPVRALSDCVPIVADGPAGFRNTS